MIRPDGWRVGSSTTRSTTLRYVLFVCHHNAGRSQIAEAFFNRFGPADVRAASAGDEPASRIWPEVVEVMQEVGIDLTARRPQRLSPELQLRADFGVTMGCGDACPLVPGPVLDWDVPDPAGRPIDEVRWIRDDIGNRVDDLLVDHLEEIRGDWTIHNQWLAKLLPSLREEFDGVRSDGEIRACADAVLGEFSDAKVRTHVLTLAHRRARDCLRQDHCDALAAR